MSVAVLLKLGKLLSVIAFFAGAIGATCSQSWTDRQRAAYWLAAPGFFGVWGFGLGLSQLGGVRLFSLWILGSALCTLIAINGVLYASGREDRATRGARMVTLTPRVVALILMVWRP